MKSTSTGIVELAHQVREEEHRALEHPDQQQVLARVVARDLVGQLAHAAAADPRRGRGSPRSLRRRSRCASLGRAPACRRTGRVRRTSHDRCAASPARRAGGRATRCRASVSAATSSARRAAPGRGPAGGLVGEPLHDEPAQRRRQLAQRGAARSPPRPPSTVVDELVEHAASSREDLGERQDVCLRRRDGRLQRRHEAVADPPARVGVGVVALVLAPAQAALAAVRGGLLAREREQRPRSATARRARRIPSSARRLGEDASR